MFTFTLLLSSIASAANLPLRFVVNGEKIVFPDAQPFVDVKGRTQVPSRFIAEALGASAIWNASQQTATFVLGNNKLELTIGQNSYFLNGEPKQMDTSAMILDARVYVPAKYVVEAFNAELKWDQAIATLYIQTNASGEVKPTPSKAPQGGTTKSYGGITFNDVSDVDKYGRIKEEKLKEFLLKLADQITFVKEEGKYVIKCTYPEIPKGFKWSIGIEVETKDDQANFTDLTRIAGNVIPITGQFTKVVPFVSNKNEVSMYSLSFTIYATDFERSESEGVWDSSLGIFEVTKTTDGILRASFVPDSGPSQYYKDFDFDRMFQW